VVGGDKGAKGGAVVRWCGSLVGVDELGTDGSVPFLGAGGYLGRKFQK